MTSSLAEPVVFGSLKGDQEPRIRSVPPYASSAGREAVDLARLAGLELDEWQQRDLIDAMGESAQWKCPRCTYRTVEPVPCLAHPVEELLHPWAAFEVAEIDPRQNGKSEIEIARELAGLFILEEPLQIYSAHLFDTSIEIFLRLEALVVNCDELRREVKHRGSKMVGIKHSHGEEGIELRGGQRVRFKARTGSGGRGFSCDRLALDEAMILPEAFLGATVPTLSARSNPQIWLLGSAPDEDDPTHDGVVLAKRRARAVKGGDKSLAYFERSASFDGDPGNVPAAVLDDRREWARANPALGKRISEEYVAGERLAMGARQFAVERLGIGAWPVITEDGDRVIGRETWSSCAERDPDRRIVRSHACAIDINPDRSWGSIGIAGQRDDDLWQFAVADRRRRTDWIVKAAVELAGKYPGAPFVVLARGPAGNLITDLEDEGLEVVAASGQDYGVACSDFYDAVDHRQVRYPFPQPELDEALSGARKGSQQENAWTWSRKASTSADISPLVTCTLALWGAQNAESEYATVLYGSDSAPTTEDPEIGPAYHHVGVGEPVVLSQDDVTSCFACRVGGCTIHTQEDS